MALKDLIKLAPAADRPDGIVCETYVRGQGKRCLHYGAGGTCSLPGAERCSEWMKANGRGAKVDKAQMDPASAPAVPTTPATPEARDLFGNALPAATRPAGALAAQPVPAAGAAPPRSASSAAPELPAPLLPEITAADIASFKALGVEVRMHSEAVGELWLVPAYTGKPRREITPEHAVTLMHVRSVFPGAQVATFHPPTNPERRERPARRS